MRNMDVIDTADDNIAQIMKLLRYEILLQLNANISTTYSNFIVLHKPEHVLQRSVQLQLLRAF